MISCNVHPLQRVYDRLHPMTVYDFWEVLGCGGDICLLEFVEKWLLEVGAVLAECHPADCEQLKDRVKALPEELLSLDDCHEQSCEEPFPVSVVVAAYELAWFVQESQLLTAQDVQMKELSPGLFMQLIRLEVALRNRAEGAVIDRHLLAFSGKFSAFVDAMVES